SGDAHGLIASRHRGRFVPDEFTTLRGGDKEAAVSVLAIWTWSCRPDDVDEVRAALDELVAHCDSEHPLIRRLGWFSAVASEGGEVEFRWLEEYESRESMARDELTDVCAALWQPVRSRAIAGSFAGGAFDRGGGIER
ncbi:MAG: hypothetical protein ACXVZW_07340, partial [Gaiellaceae bacterium]